MLGKRGLAVKIYCKTKASEQVVLWGVSLWCPSSIFKIMTVITEALRADICWLPRVNHVSWSRAQWRNVIIAEKKKHTFHSLFHYIGSNFFFLNRHSWLAVFMVKMGISPQRAVVIEDEGIYWWMMVFYRFFVQLLSRGTTTLVEYKELTNLCFHWHFKLLFWAIAVYSGSMVRAMFSCVLWMQTNGCP